MNNSASHEPMDMSDLQLLSDIVALYDAFDPMPPILPDVVLFALGTTDVDGEMARLVESEAGLVGTRGAPVEHARRVTFASEHLTVMIAVDPQASGLVRVDGWAAPGGALHVELRSGECVLTTECDDAGRFVFDAVPVGPAQLVLNPTLSSDPAIRMPVVTPALHL
jgi:hypothetical protein